MAKSLPTKGKPFPPEGARSSVWALASFRFTYAAIVAFVVLYVYSVKGAERFLHIRFQHAVEAAAQADWHEGSVVSQIRRQVGRAVRDSAWVRPGGVQVTAIVLGKDGSPLYVPGLAVPPADSADPAAHAREAERVLPPSIDVTVAVPHNSLVANALLVGYGAALLTGLYLYQRAVAQRQQALLAEAMSARDATLARAGDIERELEGVRQRLSEVGTAENEHAREIEGLRSERASLLEKLDALARRESELLSQQSSGAPELQAEHQALEELLDEALTDLRSKDEEIESLQSRLRRASKDAAAAVGARSRESDHLGRRLRTLYKNLEVDDRALSDLVGLRDEGMQLKAEELLKRLSDDVETAGARRKVGGLPAGMPVFELGFAGKGRIYYTHGSQRRLRILCVGAKNSQKTDLEYLSRSVKG